MIFFFCSKMKNWENKKTKKIKIITEKKKKYKTNKRNLMNQQQQNKQPNRIKLQNIPNLSINLPNPQIHTKLLLPLPKNNKSNNNINNRAQTHKKRNRKNPPRAFFPSKNPGLAKSGGIERKKESERGEESDLESDCLAHACC